MKTIEERFWPKVQITPGCWPWTAGRGGSLGHGAIRVGSQMTNAHRVSYEIHFGPIPSGLVVRHKCDNPPCVNPDHLELGTQAENVKDMWRRGRGNPIRGEGHPSRKLSDRAVAEIITAKSYRGLIGDLAERYGVSKVRISQIRRGIDVPHVSGGKDAIKALINEGEDE